VSLRSDGAALVLEIHDDGVGFDPESPPASVPDQHFGLMTMRERVEMAGGRFSVRSSPGSGTHVRASLPAVLEPRAT
jgi:signal transduction histidine kinase